MSRKLSTGDRRPAWMNMEVLGKLRHKKEVYRRCNQGQVTWKGYGSTVQACSGPGKPKITWN